jgi:hypothetical protein
MGCYDFPGETWAGDGSAHKGVMGAGSVYFQRPGRTLEVRVGGEEGISSLTPELAAIARTLQALPLETDLLYLCDSEGRNKHLQHVQENQSKNSPQRSEVCPHDCRQRLQVLKKYFKLEIRRYKVFKVISYKPIGQIDAFTLFKLLLVFFSKIAI